MKTLALDDFLIEAILDLEDGNYTFLGEEEVLPLEVVRWAELDEDDPWVNTDEDNGCPFTEIADLIEESL